VPHEPSPETCNDIDDDCDGTVDDVSQTTCGVGACRRTVEDCVAGQPNSCVPGQPGQETCNGIDDDCDGAVDEELGYTSCGVGAWTATSRASTTFSSAPARIRSTARATAST